MMLGLGKRFMIVGKQGASPVKWNVFCDFLDYLQGQGVKLETRRDDHSLRYYRKDTGHVVGWSEDIYPGPHDTAGDMIERAYALR